MADSITTIQFMFDYMGQKSYQLIDKAFIERCINELRDLLLKIPKSEKQHEHLTSLICFVHKGSWTEAFKILPKAEAEYIDLTHKRHCDNDDNNKPSVYIAEQDKHETTSGAHGYDHQPVNIHDQNMKGPNDGHKSGICIEGGKRNQPQKLEDSKYVYVQGQSNSGKHDQANETPNYNNGNALSIPSRTLVSRDASNQLKQNNPNIADLSDPNRPTKLAERFSELYDNEWTNAYEAILKLKVTETNGVKLLIEVVQKAYTFCTDIAEQQMKDLEMCCKCLLLFGSTNGENDGIPMNETGDKSGLVLYRKSIAGLAVNRLQKTFCEDPSNLNALCSKVGITKTPSATGPMVLFANKCLELCWWMCVQDPPICLDATTDTEFNTTMYRAYTKSGTSVDFYVWPALMLYKGGPVLMKGVAQCK